MKICPQCRSVYSDETLQFCLQDGTPLVDESATGKTNLPTASLGGEAFEQETVVANKDSEKIRFGLENEPEKDQKGVQTNAAPPPFAADRKKNPKTIFAVLLTVLTMLFLFGLIGIVGYFYLSESARIKNDNASRPENSDYTRNDSAEKIPEISLKENQPDTVKTKKPEETESPQAPEKVDLEEVKKGVTDRIFKWKNQSETLRLDEYMNSYADTVDYYNKNGASKNFVRSDKRKAFEKFDSIKFNLSNIGIVSSRDGQTATVVFDKEWNFQGASENSSGKVRQQLKLKKAAETWLITSEKDLKVYYINK